MNRRPSQIRPLLAGRIRPHRHPPSRRDRQASAPSLRLSTVPPIEAAPPSRAGDDAEDCHRVLNDVRRIEAALRVALNGVEQVQRLLHERGALDSPGAETGRRPGRKASTSRDRLRAVVRAIDRIVDDTVYEGARLLDGAWSVVLADSAGKGVRPLRIRSLAARDLGEAAAGGSVASLRTDHSAAPWHDDLPRRRAVLRCAMLQVAAVRERIDAYLRDAVAPLIHVLEVTAANTRAARQALEEAAFAPEVGRLTPVEALVQQLEAGPRPSGGPMFSALAVPAEAPAARKRLIKPPASDRGSAPRRSR